MRRLPAAGNEFVAGVYPLLADETCYFLAMDFDRDAWRDDVRAVMETCRPTSACRAGAWRRWRLFWKN